jgi:hypothetical protein
MELLEANALVLTNCDLFIHAQRVPLLDCIRAFMLTPNIYALSRIAFALKRGIG